VHRLLHYNRLGAQGRRGLPVRRSRHPARLKKVSRGFEFVSPGKVSLIGKLYESKKIEPGFDLILISS
jgi:hypothetical protein